MAALEQLEIAYDALRNDPVFWAELRDLLAHFAGRPTALYRADRLAEAVRARGGAARRRRRPGAAHPGPPALPQARGPRPHRGAQDQQRARPGAADPAARQDPGDRRDRRRPARRGDRDGLRAARPAVRRLHGRRGHRTPGPQRPADARAGRRGPLGDVGDGDAQGRGQRGDARLGDQRRDDPLRAGFRDGSAPVPDDRPRPPAPDRRRGGGPAVRGRGAAARSRHRLRRWRLERDRLARPVHRRADGPAGGRRGGGRRHRDRTARGGDPGRDARHPPRLAIADAPGRGRPGHRGALRVGRPRLPGDRPAARRARRGRPDRGRRGHRPRSRRRDEDDDAHGGDPPGARDRARGRGTPQAPGGGRRGRRLVARTRSSSCSGSPAVATRTSPRSSASPRSAVGDKDLAALERFAEVEPWEGAR